MNECRYWKGLYEETNATMAEDQRIIKDLQEIYLEWKGKFLNLSIVSNSIIQELPEKLQEADWCMCHENTPYKVFNFVKFYKKMLKFSLTILQRFVGLKCSFKDSFVLELN